MSVQKALSPGHVENKPSVGPQEIASPKNRYCPAGTALHASAKLHPLAWQHNQRVSDHLPGFHRGWRGGNSERQALRTRTLQQFHTAEAELRGLGHEDSHWRGRVSVVPGYVVGTGEGDVPGKIAVVDATSGATDLACLEETPLQDECTAKRDTLQQAVSVHSGTSPGGRTRHEGPHALGHWVELLHGSQVREIAQDVLETVLVRQGWRSASPPAPALCHRRGSACEVAAWRGSFLLLLGEHEDSLQGVG